MAYIGEIRLFAGTFEPNGWAFCDGRTMAISEHDTLFNLIGTTYGGDGQETFALPDLQGRVPVHQGTLPLSGRSYVLGEEGGVEEVTLSVQQIPAHSHGFGAIDGLPGTRVSPADALPAMSLSVVPYLGDAPSGDAEGRLAAAAVQPAGGSQPHENMQPFLGLSFIISLYGEYPQPS